MSSYSEDPSDDEEVEWEEVDVGGIGDVHEDSNRKVAFNIVLSKAGEQQSTKLDLHTSPLSVTPKKNLMSSPSAHDRIGSVVLIALWSAKSAIKFIACTPFHSLLQGS
jgi:hypothetical protein